LMDSARPWGHTRDGGGVGMGEGQLKSMGSRWHGVGEMA